MMCFRCLHICGSLFLAILFVHAANAEQNSTRSKKVEKGCNFYQGSWVYDKWYPLYNSTSCPFVRKEFACQKYGRPNSDYLKYRWQPKKCDLPRFDGKDFLKKMEGKKIMFIGDSLTLNFYESLTCLLYAAVPHSNITFNSSKGSSISSVNFQDHGVSVMMFRSNYLVDIETEQGSRIRRILKLDSIKNGKIWKKMDILVFGTWRWWSRKGSTTQPWDYIQEGDKLYKDMDHNIAMRKGLITWAKWVNSDVNSTKTKVFFQGVTPSHYDGKDWNVTGVKNCAKETEPIKGSTYPGILPSAMKTMKDLLSTIKKPVALLDLTTLSALRKDGHPSMYNGFKGMDCTHWCIPGVPDIWNQLLYNSLLH